MMLSQISLGCMRFTGETPEEQAISVVEQAVESGINHIETARGYGNSEERVGKALKRILRRVPREKLHITTKIGPSSNVDDFKRNWDLTQAALDIETIDGLAFHCAGSLEQIRPAMTDRGCLGFVRKLQDEGVVRHLGFSTHGYPHGVLDLVDTREFAFINLHYYFFYQGLKFVVQRAHELDMGVFIISPSQQGGNLHHPTPELVEACRPLHPVTFNQMWLLRQPEVHTISCGPSHPDQIERNLLAQDFDGAGADRETFDRVLAHVERAYRQSLGHTYCTVCFECLPCPEDINIPGLLAWRNMAAGFNMTEYARGRYSRVGQGGAWVPGRKGDHCTKCGDCLPRCPEKLAIPELLWDAHQRLETGEIRPPMWKHEGDLLKRDLKQD
jgi:predicted aldo/keto reductase-like oxidoreductase